MRPGHAFIFCKHETWKELSETQAESHAPRHGCSARWPVKSFVIVEPFVKPSPVSRPGDDAWHKIGAYSYTHLHTHIYIYIDLETSRHAKTKLSVPGELTIS